MNKNKKFWNDSYSPYTCIYLSHENDKILLLKLGGGKKQFEGAGRKFKFTIVYFAYFYII